MIVKVLGLIDIFAGSILFMQAFRIEILSSIIIIFSILLLIKSIFIFSGNLFSFIDLVCAILILSSLFFAFMSILLFGFAFLLFAKGIISLL